MRNKGMALWLLLAVVGMLALSGCGGNEEKKEGDGGTKVSEERKQDESVTGAKPPVKLTMFMSNAGYPVGDGNISDNPYIKVVEEMANVDLDITYPEMADTKTKFDLTMASGEIPDLVHSTYPEEIKKYGLSGAFLPLNDIIAQSPVLSKLYPEEILNAQKASDGNIYGIYALDAKVPTTTIARLDLIEKLNGGQAPSTPDEWYAFLKKVKANNPAAVPYTSQGQLSYLDTFFRAYGVNVGIGGSAEWQLQDDKVINALEHPNMKEALAFYKKLYDEKLLDQQFVANKGGDWVNRIVDNDMSVWNSGPFSFNWVNHNWGSVKHEYDKIVGFVPHPVAPGVNPEDVYIRNNPMGFHVIAISKKTKDVDAAVRTIEAFLSEKLLDTASWGIEGVDYTLVDGKKVPNAEVDQKTTWRGAYLFMYQYWPPQAVAHTAASQALAIPDEGYRQRFLDNIDRSLPIAERENNAVGYSPWALMPSNDITAIKLPEAYTLAQTIMSKAIVGNITMEQFDQEVKKFMDKYKDITDMYQKYYDENKEMIRKLTSKP